MGVVGSNPTPSASITPSTTSEVIAKLPTYHIWTIGCQMNKAESTRIASLLEQQGYRPSDSADEADVIVLNSCVVRASAESRVVNKLHVLRRLKKTRPDLVLVLTGCLVDSDETALRKAYPHVDHFFRAGDLPDWLFKDDRSLPLPEHAPVSVYVPIIQGCNNFCTYCIVPYRRGREHSRPIAQILSEVEGLVNRGAKEVVLLGQNVDSYGHDLPERPDLADLLTEINNIEGLLRIRFLTNHPKDMSSKLIDRVAALDKVCRHINLPVQAGDDDVLKAMRRGYTVARYRELVAEIRERIPGVALSTDLIVGFPGETEEQFRHSVDLLTELRFDAVHAACYSPRAGTVAARDLADDVPREQKSQRLAIIEQTQKRILTEINAGLLGRTVEVLIDGRSKGKWRGRTGSDKVVFVSGPGDFLGRLVRVKVTRTSPWSLQGSVADSVGHDKEAR